MLQNWSSGAFHHPNSATGVPAGKFSIAHAPATLSHPEAVDCAREIIRQNREGEQEGESESESESEGEGESESESDREEEVVESGTEQFTLHSQSPVCHHKH